MNRKRNEMFKKLEEMFELAKYAKRKYAVEKEVLLLELVTNQLHSEFTNYLMS